MFFFSRSLLLRSTVIAAATLALTACVTTGTAPSSDALAKGQALNSPQAAAHTRLAMGYYERGQFDVALEELDTAKGFDSSYALVYNGYGLVYSYMNENARARENFQRAIQLAPANTEIRHNWGWFLCTSGFAAQSLPEFDKVIADPFYPTPEIALTNAGRCALNAKKTEEARRYLQRALTVKPNYTPAAFTLADLSYRQGSFNDARQMMRVVMQNPQPSPDALYLGACIERRLKDKRSEESYISQLKNRFPKSEQAQKIARPNSCQ